jgi:hypothetical protein
MISTGACSQSTPAIIRLSEQPLQTQSTDLSRRERPSSPTPMSLRNQSSGPLRSKKRCLRPRPPTPGHKSNLFSPYVTSTRRQNSKTTTAAVAAVSEDNNRFTRPKTPDGAVKGKFKRLPPSGASKKRSKRQTLSRKDGNCELKPSSSSLSNATRPERMFMSFPSNGEESEVSSVSDKSKEGQGHDDNEYGVKGSRKYRKKSITTSSRRLRKIIDKVNERDDKDSSEDGVSSSPTPVKGRRFKLSSVSSEPSQGNTPEVVELYQKMVERIFPKDDDGLIVKEEVDGEDEVIVVEMVEVKQQ